MFRTDIGDEAYTNGVMPGKNPAFRPTPSEENGLTGIKLVPGERFEKYIYPKTLEYQNMKFMATNKRFCC